MYRPLPSIGSKSCLWVVGWMYQVDVYLRVRRAVMVDGMSIREVSRVFGLHRDTVRKILAYSAPPGYRRQTPPRRPKLEPFTAMWVVNTHHTDPQVVFAGSRYGYLYRSDDGGDSWTKLWREFSEISSVLWVPG